MSQSGPTRLPTAEDAPTMAGADNFLLLVGNANLPLGDAICGYAGIRPTQTSIRRFSDMEVFVEIRENARGREVFILQPTSYPANDNVMELLVTIDAAKRGSAKRITAVIPYYGYSRQDRKTGSRSPISARLMANLIETAGADRVLTVDLHAAQIQGFFNIPVDNLYGRREFVRFMRAQGYEAEKTIIVSPDVGGVARARSFATRLGCDLAIIDKRRQRAGHSEVMHVIGDVAGRACILIDDMVDSGGTLCNAAEALLSYGASEVSAFTTHGVLSGGAVSRIGTSALKKLYITDTILPREAVRTCPKIEIISLAELLATAIHNTYYNKSISALFD